MSSLAAVDVMIPEKLGPYRLGRRLGRGGMGSVYEGIDEQTDERVAVKVLSADFSHERDFRERFSSEIETLRRLRHPHIVRLFGFGQEEGQLFYAMELVDGVSLEEEIRQGRRFQWQEVVRIGQQTCDALRHAHDRGVIHRDIKPANLLLADDESIKLSDFGIAKMFGHVQLTAVGSVIGTVEYMSPEQADARPLDARADLYSLGGVLYALLAGRAPLVADSLPEMLRKQRHEMPEPLDRFINGVPHELSELIQQLLQKQPNRRVTNARLLTRRFDALETRLMNKSIIPPEQAENPDQDESEASDGFDLRQEPSANDDPTGLMPTRAMDSDEFQEGSDSGPPSRDADVPLPQTLTTGAFQLSDSGDDDENEEASEEAPPPEEPVTHFTPVSEEELDQIPSDENKTHPLISIQTWILAASLLMVGLTALYFLHPPSANKVYSRITSAAADGNINSIKGVEDKIEYFLSRFPEDPRCDEVQGLQHKIALDRLETRFNILVKRLGDTEGLLPIQKAYLEARNYLWLDPEKGVAKLRAMIDLYGEECDMSGPTGQCLELARRRLEKLEKEKLKTDKEYLEMIRSRLNEADSIIDSDPQKAKTMYRAIVELYSTKPWAADVVRHAQEAIDRLKDQVIKE